MTGLAELRTPFPAEQIGKLPKGNVTLDYVGHADVTARLLDVDPAWKWEPFATTEEGLPALDQFGNLWIRLTVLDVTRIGVGDGKSMKECIGDAIRNAAMRFGVALDLWAKGDRNFGTAGHDAPARDQVVTAPPESEALKDLAQLCRDLDLDEKQIAQDYYDGHGHTLRQASVGAVRAYIDVIKSGGGLLPDEDPWATEAKS